MGRKTHKVWSPAPFARGEAGFGVLEALVAVALLGAGVFAFAASMGYVFRSQQAMASTKSVREVESALMQTLADQLRNPASGCLGAAGRGAALGVPIGSSTLSAVPAGGGRRLIPVAVANPAADHARAAAACNAPVDTATTRYFCVGLATGAAQPVGSFYRSAYAFAEVSISMRDLGRGTPMNCAAFTADYVSNGNAAYAGGAEVHYSIYWSVRTGSGYAFTRRNGSMVVK